MRKALGQEGQGLLHAAVQSRTAALLQCVRVLQAPHQTAQQGPEQQARQAQLPGLLLGEVLLRHVEEAAHGERHGRHGRGQVGEDEGQGLDDSGCDSWKEAYRLFFWENNPTVSATSMFQSLGILAVTLSGAFCTPLGSSGVCQPFAMETRCTKRLLVDSVTVARTQVITAGTAGVVSGKEGKRKHVKKGG
ncbi:hypothetical protein EYF80_057007 [Liparis tanakae]|uniref:Uncharacterized protein n=1 Tax=Liparis tanakae TaxID=230148 RepID=A0A4Z2EW87_9TELE|nr:hypothetical protein EYF80_057007 [Liparis tanakae]